ncbi:MAG: hemerythrin domain-containing protein [Euryarchaeota archaeon]|nr:hemerythrin domain-containing protein [Euryarchaeota archaeon]
MLSTKAGTLDYADTAALDEFHDELSAMMTNLRLHVAHEEATIHPMLAGCIPGGAERLEEEHRTGKHLVENLSAHLEGIQAKSPESTKRGALGLEFYLALNRFIAFYLDHINEEEEHAQAALWRYYTNDELGDAWATIQTSQSPEESIDNFEMILPALNIDDSPLCLLLLATRRLRCSRRSARLQSASSVLRCGQLSNRELGRVSAIQSGLEVA